MAMEPEARIAPPEGNGEPLENMSGGRDRVHGADEKIFFPALIALKLLVSLISRLVACSARIDADKQTHRTTTVTLAAHARRGLIIWNMH